MPKSREITADHAQLFEVNYERVGLRNTTFCRGSKANAGNVS